MQNQWRCVYVRKRFERFVALHLEKLALETFVPFRRMHERSRKSKARIEAPLFPGYVFFKGEFVDERVIRLIPGVLAIVRSAEAIGIVLAHEIEDLQRVLDSRIPYELWPHVPGTSVTVEDGPLRRITGVLANTIEKRRLIVPISLLCRSVAIEIDDSWRFSQNNVFP